MSSYFKHYKSRLLLLQHSFVHLLKCRYTFNLQYLPPLIFLTLLVRCVSEFVEHFYAVAV